MLGRITKLLLIHDSERGQVAYFLSLFLILGAGMALGRATSDALFFKRYGIEYLPLMFTVLAGLLMLVCTAYAAFSDRISAERFFKTLFGVLVILLIFNWYLISFTTLDGAYPLYFLIYEIASELLLVHGSLYLSQNFDVLQSKRLLPLILGGAQVGTVIGGLFLAGVAHTLGVQNILLIWCALLLVATALIVTYHRRIGASPYFRPGRRSKAQLRQAVQEVVQGVRFMKHSELLRSLSIALFFMVISFYILCYSVNRVYTATFTTEESLTAFFGVLTAVNSTAALLLQFLVTNRILARFGVKRVNLIFPTMTLLSFGGLIIAFALPAALLASFNKETIMNAFRNPVRNLFFNALPNYMQGRARAMSVALVMPLALAFTGGFLMLAQTVTNPLYFLLLGAATSALYLIHSVNMNRRYLSGLVGVLKEKVFLPDDKSEVAFETNDPAVVEQLAAGVQNKDEDISLAYSKALLGSCPTRAADIILPRLANASHKLADQTLRQLAAHDPPEVDAFLLKAMDNGDDHLKATALMTLIDRGNPELQAHIGMALSHSNPRLRAAGIYGGIKVPALGLEARADDELHHLLDSQDVADNIAALQLIRVVPDPRFEQQLLRLLQREDARILAAALDTLRNWPQAPAGLSEFLQRVSRHPQGEIRAKCVGCCTLLPAQERVAIATRALEDDHPAVRIAAVETLFYGSEDICGEISAWITGNRVSPRAQHALFAELLKHHPPRNVLEQLVDTKSRDAHDFTAAHAALTTGPRGFAGNSAFELVQYILQERRQQAMELALLAMEHIEDPETIAIIRAGLSSRDPRHVANASEALRNINDDRLVRLIAVPAGGAQDEGGASSPFGSVRDVLTWCSERMDPWLSECAVEAMNNAEPAEA